MPERTHLAIGEVLGLLQEEFPDITISKIRFLESQGLLDPERTPSGYRKFYDDDIDRLRWILRQQRDQFLPLRVIKARLEGIVERVEEGPARGVDAGRVDAGRVDGEWVDDDRSGASTTTVAPVPEPLWVATPPAPGPDPSLPQPSAPAPPALPGLGEVVDPVRTEATFTRTELAAAAGLGERDLDQLVQYGLLRSRIVGREEVFDHGSYAVACLAVAFARFGVEARHLRMYKTFADREVAVYEQLVTPLVRQRNPSSRDQAGARFGELADLGRDLREALLRQALRDLLP